MLENYKPECLRDCPQLSACASRAVLRHALAGEDIAKALEEELRIQVDDGRLPEVCREGPRQVKMMDPRSPAEQRNDIVTVDRVSQSVLTSFYWDTAELRVCEAEMPDDMFE